MQRIHVVILTATLIVGLFGTLLTAYINVTNTLASLTIQVADIQSDVKRIDETMSRLLTNKFAQNPNPPPIVTYP